MLLISCFLNRNLRSPLDILGHFYDHRVEFYTKRKVHLTGKLTEDWEKLDNKVYTVHMWLKVRVPYCLKYRTF